MVANDMLRRGCLLWFVVSLSACSNGINLSEEAFNGPEPDPGPAVMPDVEPEPDPEVEPTPDPDPIMDPDCPESMNACLGCEILADEPSSPCGACQDGHYICSTPNETVCVNETPDNACGGCAVLDGQIGGVCGTCDSGRLACAEDGESLVCEGDGGRGALNECGSCGDISAQLGQPCGGCGLGQTVCGEGPGEVVCDAVCPDFAPLRAETFVIGAQSGEPDGNRDREPLRTITLTRPFEIQTTEVTIAQWRSVLGTAPAFNRACGDDCPVERVNWFDAIFFLNQLSVRVGLEPCYLFEQEADCSNEPGSGCPEDAESCDMGVFTCSDVGFVGLDCEGYRLPTEAEWEFAARARSVSAFPTGEVSDEANCNQEEVVDLALDRIGWYCRNSSIMPPESHRVAQKEPNGFGLYDTHGNVHEWCQDNYVDHPPSMDATDPLGEMGPDRSIRGGSFEEPAKKCRSAKRTKRKPEEREHDVGFRPVRTLTEGDL